MDRHQVMLPRGSRFLRVACAITHPGVIEAPDRLMQARVNSARGRKNLSRGCELSGGRCRSQHLNGALAARTRCAETRPLFIRTGATCGTLSRCGLAAGWNEDPTHGHGQVGDQGQDAQVSEGRSRHDDLTLPDALPVVKLHGGIKGGRSRCLSVHLEI